MTSTNGKVVSNMHVFRGVSMQAGPDVTAESCEKLRETLVLRSLKELKPQEGNIVRLS